MDIEKRFEELTDKAEEVGGTSKPLGRTGINTVDPEVFEAWAASVLYLIKEAFSEDSTHFVNFKNLHDAFDGTEDKYKRSKGAFLAAREDYAKK